MNLISLPSRLVCLALLVGALPAWCEERSCVVVNTNVPVESLTGAALKDVFTGRTAYWPNGQKVVIVLLSTQADGALNEASGMGLNQFKTFWRRMVFWGHGRQPRQAEDAAALLAEVVSMKGAIALVPEDAPLKGVKALTVIGASALIAPRRQEKPARDLAAQPLPQINPGETNHPK